MKSICTATRRLRTNAYLSLKELKPTSLSFLGGYIPSGNAQSWKSYLRSFQWSYDILLKRTENVWKRYVWESGPCSKDSLSGLYLRLKQSKPPLSCCYCNFIQNNHNCTVVPAQIQLTPKLSCPLGLNKDPCRVAYSFRLLIGLKQDLGAELIRWKYHIKQNC